MKQFIKFTIPQHQYGYSSSYAVDWWKTLNNHITILYTDKKGKYTKLSKRMVNKLDKVSKKHGKKRTIWLRDKQYEWNWGVCTQSLTFVDIWELKRKNGFIKT